jgi:Metallo-beta-lactamase superfamily
MEASASMAADCYAQSIEQHRWQFGHWIGAPATARALVLAPKLLLASIFCLICPLAHAGLDRYQDLVVTDGNPHAALPKHGVRVALNLAAVPKRELIERYLPVRKIDAVIVTHGHIDHLLDVAEIMTLTGAKLIAYPPAPG